MMHHPLSLLDSGFYYLEEEEIKLAQKRRGNVKRARYKQSQLRAVEERRWKGGREKLDG